MLERILFKKRHLDGHTNKADLSNLNKQLKNFVSSSSLLDSSNKVSFENFQLVFQWVKLPVYFKDKKCGN